LSTIGFASSQLPIRGTFTIPFSVVRYVHLGPNEIGFVLAALIAAESEPGQVRLWTLALRQAQVMLSARSKEDMG